MNVKDSVLVLKPGREKSLLRRHPWVFSGAVRNVVGDPQSGYVVDIKSSKNEFLAKGAYSHDSQITARVWSWKESETINESFLFNRLQASITRRAKLL